MKRFCIQQYISTFLTVICFLTVCSCGEKIKQGEAGNENGVSRVYQEGPVKVTLFLSREEITTADRLTLSIEAVLDENLEIELPEVGKSLEQFNVADDTIDPPELVGKSKKKIRRSYLLEPFLSGDYTIPPIQIKYRKKGDAGEDFRKIETEALTIRVKSLLSGKTNDLKLNEIKPPVELSGSYALLIYILAAVVVAFISAVFVFRRRKRISQGTVDKRLPAHVIAFRELEELSSNRLPEKGQVKLFYQLISNIVRRYIENRFGLRAPEQTTEEFLTGLDFETKLDKKFKPLLRQFLMQCDLVKFAEHLPESEDIDKTFENCRAFIEQTKEFEIEPQ